MDFLIYPQILTAYLWYICSGDTTAEYESHFLKVLQGHSITSTMLQMIFSNINA